MNTFCGAIAWISCIFIFTVNTTIASQYIPWQENDTLLFKSDTNKQQTISVDRTFSLWRHVTTFSAFGPSWIYSGSRSEEVKLYSPDAINFQTFIDFSDPVGSSRSITLLPCNTGSILIAEKNVSLSVPAGTFIDVIRLELETNCSDAGVTDIWFAKNIGIVQWTELNIAGAEMFKLNQATIGGNMYPENKGLIVQAQFPDSKIWIDQLPPLPNETPTAKIGLQIENYLDHQLIYQFNNSQRYDIIIRNESGDIANQWSRDKVFIQVIGEEIIQPGGKFHITDTIELIDDKGNVLVPGNYQFEIFLTASNGPKAIQIIEIDHAH